MDAITERQRTIAMTHACERALNGSDVIWIVNRDVDAFSALEDLTFRADGRLRISRAAGHLRIDFPAGRIHVMSRREVAQRVRGLRADVAIIETGAGAAIDMNLINASLCTSPTAELWTIAA